MKLSPIEWTMHTGNLWFGCAKVHKGCMNCYANVIAKRFGHDVWGINKFRRLIKSFLSDLRKYQKFAENADEIHRVFVGSMMDIFEKPMPLIDCNGNELDINTGDLRAKFFENISKGMYPNLMFLLLTKRPSNINKYIPEEWKISPPENVMFGTSPVDQETANKLIGQLVQVNGRRFLSIEPQLGRISLMPWLQNKSIDWVINGGESGPGKRPFNTDWARRLKAECRVTNTPFFFKQIDKVKDIPVDLEVREFYR